MVLNLAIGLAILLLLGWSAWDKYRQDFHRGKDFVPPMNDTNQDRLLAIASAEEFRRYAKQSGAQDAYNLTGEAIASLYRPEEITNGES